MRELLQIGEVAKLVGVSSKTIRYYQEVGLLAEPKRTEAGYRLYNAQDLLRLQRIRRLRSLGLSLERIKEILGEPDYEHERMLRKALQLLLEELSAQISELEGRREMLKRLLTEDWLEGPQTPGEEPPALYFDLVKEHLGAYLSNIDEEGWKWGEKIDAMLGSFHWPASYREKLKEAVEHIAGHPEQYSQLLALENRFAALANAPEDSPEIEQLAEDYVRSGEIDRFHSTFFTGNPLGSPQLEHALGDLASEMVSPAQRRFFEVMQRKLSASPGNRGESI